MRARRDLKAEHQAHVADVLLDRYAAGGLNSGPDVLWAVEAHLESCSQCRLRLAERVGADTRSLLLQVRARLEIEMAGGAQMPARRRRLGLTRWAPPGVWSRLAMTMLVVAAALVLDLVEMARVLPSLVLLVAPVVPLLAVAAVWSTGLDPAHELVVASPRAGLYMVLRRTFAVLVAVIPPLTIAGLLTGASPARWLLPCLAFTAGALALGELVGLPRAAGTLALIWTAGVIAPSLMTASLPALLEPASLPYWGALVALMALALVLRRDAYRGLRRDTWFAR
jgi:hypothetical protein